MTPETNERTEAVEVEAVEDESVEISVSREIAAPPERVYALWLDPARMPDWFGIDGIENHGARIDARVGGEWHFDASGEKGPFSLRGRYLALEPGRRILMTWQHVAGDGTGGNETEAEVLIEPIPGGCRVTVHHRLIRFTPDAFRDGWSQSLARIAGIAEAG